MHVPRAPHSWNVTPQEAVAIQRTLARRVIHDFDGPRPRWIAGVDAAYSRDGSDCIAGVVLWDMEARRVIETHVARRPIRFPYVPGLLSFREAPAVLAALRLLRQEPDVILVDGQGFAHPRRFGIACHVGLLTDRPTIGCAKSILVGTCRMPRLARGSKSSLMNGDECLGKALRTRDNVKPIYVSVGHRMSLEYAVELVLLCSVGYRLPEPTRLADQLVARARF